METINGRKKPCLLYTSFVGALARSTVTYVGCKDYDDDIDNLQTQIDAVKAVSYTHLDVYKRQTLYIAGCALIAYGLNKSTNALFIALAITGIFTFFLSNGFILPCLLYTSRCV